MRFNPLISGADRATRVPRHEVEARMRKVSIPSLAGQTARLPLGRGDHLRGFNGFNPLISGADRATDSGSGIVPMSLTGVSIPSLAGQTARPGTQPGTRVFERLTRFNPLISGADRATVLRCTSTVDTARHCFNPLISGADRATNLLRIRITPTSSSFQSPH